LPAARREAIGREFWEVGRLTLEPWLTPRLPPARVRSRPETVVAGVAAVRPSGVAVRLSGGDVIDVDRILFATGYEPRLDNLPYLAPLLGDVRREDGFPVLDETFQSSVPGLYFTGFAASRDFGPFFGFTRGCTAAATIAVDAILTSL
jgi:pyruvate/2-oxoglutarate dehydrogenase complex dihydrolipoamide dehydrogenase (E3) component